MKVAREVGRKGNEEDLEEDVTEKLVSFSLVTDQNYDTAHRCNL